MSGGTGNVGFHEAQENNKDTKTLLFPSMALGMSSSRLLELYMLLVSFNNNNNNNTLNLYSTFLNTQSLNRVNAE